MHADTPAIEHAARMANPKAAALMMCPPEPSGRVTCGLFCQLVIRIVGHNRYGYNAGNEYERKQANGNGT